MAKPMKSSEVPVTVKMLYSVRDEMNSKFLSLEHKLNSHDKRFDAIDAKFSSLDERVKSSEQRLMAEIHKMVLIGEEQRNQNRMVMDLLTNLFERQDRVEKLLTNN
jgi:hypothetical protein